MSLLNTANDGLPGIFAALYDFMVNRESGATEEEILANLDPLTSPGKSRVNHTLNRWTELGVFVEQKGKLRVAKEYLAAHLQADATHRSRVAARSAALLPGNNERFWETTESKAADLTRSLAWILLQDVYALDWARLADLESLQLAGRGEDVRFARNNVRLRGLQMWATFLGFAWTSDGETIIDPTLAIVDVLEEVLPEEDSVPIRTFLGRLSAVLPVLDAGDYRWRVEKELVPGSLPATSEGVLSTALSRALWNLRRRGTLYFEARADAKDVCQLVGPKQKSIEATTHVRRAGV